MQTIAHVETTEGIRCYKSVGFRVTRTPLRAEVWVCLVV